MRLEYPGRRQVQRADQPGVVRMIADRLQLDLELLVLQDDLGAGDRELAEPGIAKAAAHHDAFGLGPRLGAQEAPGHMGKLLGKFLDRGMHHGRGLGVVAHKDGIERLLADGLAILVSERILAGFAQRLAPAFQDLAEGAFGGAIAEEAVLVLELDVETVDLDRRQPRCAVAGDARGGHDVVGHIFRSLRVRGTTADETVGCGRNGDRRVRISEYGSATALPHSPFATRYSPSSLDSLPRPAISARSTGAGVLAPFAVARIPDGLVQDCLG